MALQQKIPILPSPAIASYNYTDIAEGTGVVGFYAFNSVEDTTDDYILSQNIFYSNDINTQANPSGSYPNFAKTLDLDFDLSPFNFPKIVKGTSYGNITIGGRTTKSAPNDWACYAIIKIRKWDGSTETEIGSAQTETLQGGGGASNVKESSTKAFSMSLTETHFKKGDTLRVTVEIWAWRSSSTASVGFGHDPKERTDETAANGGIIEDADPTSMKINIPFKLNL